MAAPRVVESGGLIVPLAEAGACQGAGSTTCGAVETVEESRRLTGLGLVLLVAAVLLAGGTIIQYGGGGSSSPSGSCKISSSSLLPFGPLRFFLPLHERKNGPIWGARGGVLGYSQPRVYVLELVEVSGLSRNYTVYEI